jgi:WD40 repeat protein
MAVSMISSGHRKINILNSLLVSSRNNNYYDLTEKNTDDWEEIYKKSFNYNYSNIAENLLKENYNEIISIISQDITSRNNYVQFPMTCSLPPEYFNEIQSEKYYEDISLNDINTLSYCKVIETHPQLPLYLTSTEKGIISLWSYDSNTKKSLDEYKIEKRNSKITHNITRIKFSPYGNEFIVVDKEGNIYNWSFDHYKKAKYPKNSFLKDDFIITKDATFLNNTGIIAATTNKKEHTHKTILYDFLLPPKQSKINEIDIGGNIILPISSDASFIVVNDKPGYISFVDVRKRNDILKNFKAHDEEIKSIKLSERENFLVTYGKDNFVKIWDLTNKTNPLLIEQIQPFDFYNSDIKSHINLEISDGFLFVSKDNCIKLLRNNII